MLTAARLRQLINYNQSTGEFTWRENRRGRGGCRVGQIAGTINRGRRQIGIDRRIYLANRLAVLWMTGQWPQCLVDHKNCNPLDDRWENLRQANYSENGANSRDRKSAVPLKGVIWTAGKYEARIRVNYKTINLGRFTSAEAAHAAYMVAALHHFGEFARRQ
jgi:hypothetical protein